MFDELDCVAVIHDLPVHWLARGNVGTIVQVYSADTFEVEFVDNDGKTYALATLKADQLLRLHFTFAAA
jgi:hypothetical protein